MKAKWQKLLCKLFGHKAIWFSNGTGKCLCCKRESYISCLSDSREAIWDDIFNYWEYWYPFPFMCEWYVRIDINKNHWFVTHKGKIIMNEIIAENSLGDIPYHYIDSNKDKGWVGFNRIRD